MNKQFIGMDGFIWFLGTVEDIDDPEKLGRVRVRCQGVHTQDKEMIPTEELPWAVPVSGIDSANTDGIGLSATGLLKGSIVVGFWLDAGEMQHPAITGSIGGISTVAPNGDVGFNDPDEEYPFLLEEPTTNIAARGTTGKYSGVHKATEWRIDNVNDGDLCSGSWQEPPTPSEPIYPDNTVREYKFIDGEEYGHVQEFDSTVGKERLLMYHHKTMNNFHEIHPDGKEVHKISNDHFEINLADKTILMKGDWNIEVEGNKNEYIHGDYCLKIDGHYSQTVGLYKSETISWWHYEYVGMDSILYVEWDYNVDIIGDRTNDIGGYDTLLINNNRTLDIGNNEFKYVELDSTENIGSDKIIFTLGRLNMSALDYFSLAAAYGTIYSPENLALRSDALVKVSSQVTNIESSTVSIGTPGSGSISVASDSVVAEATGGRLSVGSALTELTGTNLTLNCSGSFNLIANGGGNIIQHNTVLDTDYILKVSTP